MRNALAMILLTAAVSAGAGEPPAPAGKPRAATSPAPASKAAETGCAAPSGAAQPATSKPSSTACTFDAGVTHVHGGPAGTSRAVVPAKGKDKPPAKP